LSELSNALALLSSDKSAATRASTIAGVAESEWVDYRACPRDPRHVLLAEPCQRCDRPEVTDRALELAGKFHWLCWQTELDWTERHRPEEVHDLTVSDYITWATDHPSRHHEYLDYLARSAVFTLADVARPTPAFLAAPGKPPIELTLQPDGTVARGPGAGPGRWGCDPAGILVLNLDRTQYRIVGSRKGLHAGRRIAHGSTVGEPVLLGIWSEIVTGTGVRLTGTSITCFTRLTSDEHLERDVFVGAGQRVSLFGRGRRIAVTIDKQNNQLAYRPGERAVELSGPPPVYRGHGAHADWRIGFLQPLAV
jgi:hypothetical protein